jgi:hypothetical protein
LHYYIIYNTLKLDQTCVRRTTSAFSDSEKNDDRIKEHDDRLTSLYRILVGDFATDPSPTEILPKTYRNPLQSGLPKPKSAVNRAFETSGLTPPGRPQNCNRLFVEVKRAIDGFKRALMNAGGKEPVQHSATPDFVIAALCVLVRRELTPPITIKKLSMSRRGLANIWQYVNVSRPTMTAATKWDDFTHISPRHIRYVLHRLAPGRKNKDAPTREYTRRIISTEPEPALHPISLLCDYREAVRRYADRNLPRDGAATPGCVGRVVGNARLGYCRQDGANCGPSTPLHSLVFTRRCRITIPDDCIHDGGLPIRRMPRSSRSHIAVRLAGRRDATYLVSLTTQTHGN